MPETIGQRLQKAREYRNLTLEKVEEATRIRAQFLKALEADDFSVMPSPVQARGFLRNYAQYLDLDLDQMIEEIRAADPGPESENEPEVVFEDAPVIPSPDPAEPVLDGDTEVTSESFWQTWLRRVRRESGFLGEESASHPEPEPTPASELESALETEAGQNPESEADEEETQAEIRKNLSTLLNLANIRISRGGADASALEDESVSEPEPEFQSETQNEGMRSSQEIIDQIGAQLRQRRATISLTLDEIERHTRMRAQFLDALEKGNFDALPSPVQTRGMLSNYASFLDLDVDDILLQFAEALQARHRERYPEKPARRRGQPDIPGSVPTLRSFIAGDLVFGVGMVLLLVGFSIWGISRVVSLQSELRADVQVEATGPSISEALIGTPVETVISEVTLIPAEDTPIPDLPEGTLDIPTPAFNVNVQVNIVAIERSFLRVAVDGEVVFEGRTISGNAYPFDAEESVEVLAGNGAALRVVYNQRDMGLLGGFGQIASFIYTADEILVPTPVIPPTPTNTQFVSPTPSITPSPTATSIPVDELE